MPKINFHLLQVILDAFDVVLQVVLDTFDVVLPNETKTLSLANHRTHSYNTYYILEVAIVSVLFKGFR